MGRNMARKKVPLGRLGCPQNFIDGIGPCTKHDKTVNAERNTTTLRHAIFESRYKILIERITLSVVFFLDVHLDVVTTALFFRIR